MLKRYNTAASTTYQRCSEGTLTQCPRGLCVMRSKERQKDAFQCSLPFLGRQANVDRHLEGGKLKKENQGIWGLGTVLLSLQGQ